MSTNPYESSETVGQPLAELPRRSGLRPVEALTVIAAIGILTAMLLPAVRTTRERARRVHCIGNLKQITLALLNYESDYHGLPPAYTVNGKGQRFIVGEHSFCPT